MKHLVIALSLLLSAPAVWAEEVVRELSWTKSGQEGRAAGGEILPSTGATSFEQLKIENAQGQPRIAAVLSVEAPGISSARYAITGRVRYEGVEGDAYLELWSQFPDGSRYFSRTLAAAGPMKSMSGASDWRGFVVPFFNTEGGPPPARLELNAVLPGRGTVYLGALRLVQYGPGENPLAIAGQWWTDQAAGWLGAITGSIIGCMGALIGWLAATGRARRLAVGMMTVMMVAGILALIAGGIALAQSQPYAVYYPLLLTGGLSSVSPAALLRIVRKRYEDLELRRMSALDASSRH